jgi:hypothetical protein
MKFFDLQLRYLVKLNKFKIYILLPYKPSQFSFDNYKYTFLYRINLILFFSEQKSKPETI